MYEYIVEVYTPTSSKFSSLEDYINDIAKKGWRLIQVESSPSLVQRILYFERKIKKG